MTPVQKHWKSTFSITTLSFDVPALKETPRLYPHKPYISRNYTNWVHFCCWQYWSIFIQIFILGSKTPYCEAEWPFRVIQDRVAYFNTLKRVCNFLYESSTVTLVLWLVLPRFRDISGFVLKQASRPYSMRNFGMLSGLDRRRLGSEERSQTIIIR